MLFRRFLGAVALCLFALSATPTLAQQSDPSFNLVNRSGRLIFEVYASLATDQDWGRDRLGDNALPNGRSFTLRLPQGPCMWDLRVVYERAGGPSEDKRNINLCAVTEVVFDGSQIGQAQRGPQTGPTGNPSFNLVNQSRVTVMEAYVSLSTEQEWGPDRLGNDTVAPGRNFAIRLPEGPCLHDVRFVYENGQADERRGVNLCDVTNLVLPLQRQ
ncbi:MAG: hypothetical protein LW713_03715 [Acetobacteraceae bacterium]|jgi:hypothetical protein|nr:hypothetical protein [Acetobacteraceae bacterium]